MTENITEKKGKPTTFSSVRKKQLIFYYSMVILPIIQFCIFYIGVNFNSILLAFQQYKVKGGVPYFEFVQFDNFIRFFERFFNGGELAQMALNSLTVYGFGLLVILPMSLIFSFYIYKKYPMSEFFRIVIYLPSIISSVVTVFMYKHLIDKGIPAFGKLMGLHILEPLADPNNHMKAILIFTFICGFGMNVIMYSSAMTRIPVSVAEYASLDGVSPFREFVSITLPLIFPTISTFLIVGIAAFFTNQAYAYEMFAASADERVKTFGYYLFILARRGESEYPFAAAAGIVFTLVATPITLLLKKLLDKLDADVAF